MADDEGGIGDDRPADGLVRFRILGLPVAIHQQATQHLDGLVREFRWLASGPTDAPVRMLEVGNRLRRRSSAVMEPLHAAVAAAHDRGDDTIDVRLSAPPEAAALCRMVLALLDEADDFCRDGGMLTLAAPAPVAAYRTWFFGEFIRQVEGEEPRPWAQSPEAAALAGTER